MTSDPGPEVPCDECGEPIVFGSADVRARVVASTAPSLCLGCLIDLGYADQMGRLA